MKTIDKIYEAAMLPELWPATLQEISEEMDVGGIAVVTVDGSPLWTASTQLMFAVRRYMDEGWGERNEPLERLLRGGHQGFVRDVDLFPQDDIKDLAIVREMKRPIGYGWSAAMIAPLPMGEMLMLSVEQLWDRGPISDELMVRLEGIRPHFSRAALLAAKLQHQRAEAAVRSLEMAGVAAAVVTHRGRVLSANDLFLKGSDRLSIGARDRLHIAPPEAAALMTAALSRMAVDIKDEAPMSIAIPAGEAGSPMVLHVLPTKGRARDLFGSSTALLIATSVSARAAPSASVLRALFDLTPTESRIAGALVAGVEKADLLASFAISDETERSHVKAILRKTGMRSRVELIRLLSGLSIG